MAAVSMKTLKNRIKSVENTMQITRAMELVSTSKLQVAKKKALAVQPVFQAVLETIRELGMDSAARESVFFTNSTHGLDNSTLVSKSSVSVSEDSSPISKDPMPALEQGKSAVSQQKKAACYIVIGGDRGLAGGYNSNLIRALKEHGLDENSHVISIGKKVSEHFKNEGMELKTMQKSDCISMGNEICEKYKNQEFDHVYLAFTGFHSILSQEPQIIQVLPVADINPVGQMIIYEPSAESLLETVIRHYLSTLIYGAVWEAAASEHAARRNAMNAANKNGQEMLEDMKSQYNRARQSVITQELTEIVAGAEV